MTGSDDLCALSATELAALIRNKEVSPLDAVRQSLDRIESVQAKLNAFCFVYADEALQKAKDAEAAVTRGDELGLLHGVPIAIKDFTPTKGKRTTRGSYAFETWVPDWDPAIVRRLMAAGAILVGKTATPEFAYSSFTRSPLWGDTLNPWNPERTTGGSSGGSGAAVASGCVPLAEGTDMGGSVRIPAALCGVVGLKPSLGRIPMDILPTVFDNISHFGPLARTVADAALFVRVTEGPDETDITSQRDPMPIPDPLSGDVRGLRLALSPDLGFYAIDAAVEANLHAAAAALEDAGASVEEVRMDWTVDTVTAWSDIWNVYLAAAGADIFDEYRNRMDPVLVALMDAGHAMSAVDYRRLEEVRTRQWKSLAALFADYDALLCPTMALPAPPADALDDEFETIDAEGRLHGLDMTSVFNNVAQCPALSVPSGFSADGLPTAVQIVGRRFDDPTVLKIGAALETALPWAGKLQDLGSSFR
jgi:Asp-tRNA(Asn)/Glu-tRNA(Gln) amidotransferase A subunit family amidase